MVDAVTSDSYAGEGIIGGGKKGHLIEFTRERLRGRGCFAGIAVGESEWDSVRVSVHSVGEVGDLDSY